MTGKEAYEKDVKRCPLYHDGSKRAAWAELDDVAKLSWQINPTVKEIPKSQR